MEDPPSRKLSAEEQQTWDENGFVVLRNFWSPEEARETTRWTSEIADWPETPGKWMKWFERTERDDRMLCRVEDFIPYHAGFRSLLTGRRVLSVLDELMRESATLYKEKINFKLAGGSGFEAHQDAPAFTTFRQNFHITMLVPIDASDPGNGCLEVVQASHRAGLFEQDAGGSIDPAVAETLDWQPLPTEPGDAVFFDSFVPHRSGPNRSERSRRALYVTYGRKREGDYRSAYFQKKRAAFPPECERVPGVDYSSAAKTYNLANPIR